jgi:hypothetical protein
MRLAFRITVSRTSAPPDIARFFTVANAERPTSLGLLVAQARAGRVSVAVRFPAPNLTLPRRGKRCRRPLSILAT